MTILLALSWAYFFSGANDEGVEVGLRAAEEARTAGTVEQFAEAAYLQSMGGFGHGGEIVEEALDRLGERRSGPAGAAARRAGDGAVPVRRGFRPAECGGPRPGPRRVRAEGPSEGPLPALDRGPGHARCGRAAQLGRGAGGTGRGLVRTASGHDERALSRLINGDRAGFDADVAEMDRLGRDTRAWGPRSNAARWHVVQALLDGRFDEVEALAAHTNEVFAERRKASPGRYRLSMLFWEQGRVAELEAMAARAGLLLTPSGSCPGPGWRLLAAHSARSRSPERIWSISLRPFLGVQRMEWMCTAGHLVELAAMLEDEQCAAPLYERFLPYRGQVVAGMIACCLGSVDRHLGMMASVVGRWDEAEAHFEAALVVDIGMRSPPLLARTRYWYARMLATRPDGDRQKAAALAHQARAAAVDLGMALLADQADEVLRPDSFPRQRPINAAFVGCGKMWGFVLRRVAVSFPFSSPRRCSSSHWWPTPRTHWRTLQTSPT